MIEDLIRMLDSGNVSKILESLAHLAKRTSSKEDVNELFNLGTFPKLFLLLDCKQYQVQVLSIFANCANVDDEWRKAFHNEGGISKLVDLISKSSEPSIVCRVARLLANLSRNALCLMSVQTNFIICSLVTTASSTTHSKCQSACVRALRIICNNKQTTKMAVGCDKFTNLLELLNSNQPDMTLLCLHLVCKLLQTQAMEICFRMVQESVLKNLLKLESHPSEDIHEFVMECLFLLSLNSGCRVAVAMEGGIEVFIKNLHPQQNRGENSFKYATQSLCLCAREAVSRNKMKLCGALPLMACVLKKEECEHLHECLVAAFVWFLFDDSSLGLLIRADVTPSLLRYLDRLTSIEYEQRQELNDESKSDTRKDVSDGLDTSLREQAFKSGFINDAGFPVPQNVNPDYKPFSLETPPYHPNSPQYIASLSPQSSPEYSPSYSPQYSPPASPQSGDSSFAEKDDYCDALNESCGTSSKTVPYHFQSADGIHAMIHGTRGPINDTLLLLSRFSQAKDPSSFFLYLPGFNSLLNYLTLSNCPNPKCIRILMRITRNSHCFDIMLRKKLIPRLYLRICTGWSLEHLTQLIATCQRNAENQIAQNTNDRIEEPNLAHDDVVIENVHRSKIPESTFLSNIGGYLMSNIRDQCESAFGAGVVSNVLMAGSNELKEVCLISLPHIVRCVRLRKRVFLTLKAQNMLFQMLRFGLERDEETFVLIVEAVCALSRGVGLNVFSKTDKSMVSVRRKDVEEEYDPPKKKFKRDAKTPTSNDDPVIIELNSSRKIRCRSVVLREQSIVFRKMLSQEFIESKERVVSISDVSSTAFVTMLRFLFGQPVRLDQTCCSEKCPGKSISDLTKTRLAKDMTDNIATDQQNEHCKQKPELDKEIPDGFICPEIPIESLETLSCPETCACSGPNENSWRIAFDILACSDRFFVDELKNYCEQFLLSKITSENVVDVYMLSAWYGSKILAESALLYLVIQVQCPNLRSKYFMEILQSHEKETFVCQLESMVNQLNNSP